MNEAYEAPEIQVVGSVHELTLAPLQNKVFASPSDFHYPMNLSFNFST